MHTLLKLLMVASGQLTGTSYSVPEGELAKRGIPVPQRLEETETTQDQPNLLLALWEGRAPLASAWGFLLLLIPATFPVRLIFKDQMSPTVDIGLAIIALPVTIFFFVAMWRCAWNTDWPGLGYVSRAFVILSIIGLVYGWITAYI